MGVESWFDNHIAGIASSDQIQQVSNANKVNGIDPSVYNIQGLGDYTAGQAGLSQQAKGLGDGGITQAGSQFSGGMDALLGQVTSQANGAATPADLMLQRAQALQGQQLKARA